MSAPLERSLTVRCSVEHAFDTFTARVDLWWPPGHRRLDGSRLAIESRVGGRFFERDDRGEEALLGEVVRWEPPHRLTYTWYPGARVGPTLVDVRFVAEGAATRVEVTHSEGDAALGDEWPTRVARFERAWARVLPAFERCVETEDR